MSNGMRRETPQIPREHREITGKEQHADEEEQDPTRLADPYHMAPRPCKEREKMVDRERRTKKRNGESHRVRREQTESTTEIRGARRVDEDRAQDGADAGRPSRPEGNADEDRAQ